MPLRRLMACFALPFALACGGGGGPTRPPVASVTLTAASSGPLTSVGDTLQLTAVPRDAAGAAIPGVAILFTSSSAAAATVTQGGLVTAVANGTTTGAPTFAKLNDTSQFSATARNARLGDVTSSVTFTWSSSLPSVAGVSSAGLVTSLANGNTSIIATSNGVNGSLGVTVAQVAASVTVSASGGG